MGMEYAEAFSDTGIHRTNGFFTDCFRRLHSDT